MMKSSNNNNNNNKSSFHGFLFLTMVVGIRVLLMTCCLQVLASSSSSSSSKKDEKRNERRIIPKHLRGVELVHGQGKMNKTSKVKLVHTMQEKDTSMSNSVYFSWDDYYCTIQGLMNKEECINTQPMGSSSSNTEYCQFCTFMENDDTDGEKEEIGICVSPQQAMKAQETFMDKIHCETNHNKNNNSDMNEIYSNKKDISHCNLQGIDKDYCLNPRQVSGSNCIWCDVGTLGGFCFPTSWESTVSPFLNCSSTTTTTSGTAIVTQSTSSSSSSSSKSQVDTINKDQKKKKDHKDHYTSPFITSWDIFTSSCYKNSTEHDTCITMKDDESDEACLWCDAYVFGFCLNPQEAEKVNSFLTCTSSSSSSSSFSLVLQNEKEEKEEEHYKQVMIPKENDVIAIQ